MDRNIKSEIELALNKEFVPPEVTNPVCSVTVNIQPSAIPIKVLQHTNLAKTLFDEFNTIFDTSKVRIKPGVKYETTDDLLRHQIAEGDLVAFEGGYLEIQEADQTTLIPILKVAFGEQTLYAEVRGTSTQALHICKVLAVLLWKAIGKDRTWVDLSKYINLISFATSTTVDLGASPTEFFSSGFRDFILEDLEGAQGYGKFMGGLGQSSLIEKERLYVTASLQDLTINVAVFDKVSGRHEQYKINIIPDTVFDNNRSKVKIFSALPFDKHRDMIVRLIEKTKK